MKTLYALIIGLFAVILTYVIIYLMQLYPLLWLVFASPGIYYEVRRRWSRSC